MLFVGALAATAAAQKPPETLPAPGPEAPPPQGTTTGSALPPPPAPPAATTAPPAGPPGYPQQAYPPGYYPGYPPPGYGYPGYGYPGYGQPAYGPPPPYAQGYPAPPPYIPPPPEERGVHLHDGFYMRMALGFGSVHATIKPTGGGDEATLSGTGVAFDFGFGGAVADGFIIGGRMAMAGVSNPDLKLSGTTTGTDSSMSVGSLQAFTDIYPWANGGFHVLAGIGPAFLSVDSTQVNNSYTSDTYTSNADGWGGTVGVGWEGWVASQWGIGGMLNLNWAKYTDNMMIMRSNLTGTSTSSTPLYASKSDITVFSPNVTFTATFN